MESSISEKPRSRFGRAVAMATLFVAVMAASAADAAPPAPPVAPAPAATTEAARETARARLVEGVELLRQKQFAQALTKFDEAYALVPSANIFYDRGLAYQGLGRDADAVEAFDAFLAGADHAPAGTREKAAHEREALRERVATLAVTSDPPGAEISVDGRRRGVTPLSGALYIDAGPHEVAARNTSNGIVTTERIVAAPRETVRLTLRFGAAEAQTSSPKWAPAGAPQPNPAAALVDARRPAGSGEPGARSRFDIPALTAAGIGVAFLGAGLTFGILALKANNSVEQDSNNGASPPGKGIPFNHQTDSDGRRDQTLMEVFVSVGAAAVVTGGILYAIGHSREQAERANASRTRPQARVSIGGGASIAPGFAGGRLRLTF
jgi:hypothetical protein